MKALVIAVSDYDSSNLKSIEFCRNDGEEMYDVLKKVGYDIPDDRKLIGYVDSRRLKNTIYDFFTSDDIKPDDTLVFYYSGHGVPDKWGKTFLAPSEMDSDHPFKTGFSFDDLTDSMLGCNSVSIVTILDSCFSGSLKIGKGIDSKGGEEVTTRIANKLVEEKSDKLKQGVGRCLLAASQGYEEAYDRQEKDHSVFTYYLLEGLKGHENAVNEDGNITYDTLGRFITREIGNLPIDKRPKQTPIRKGEVSGGEIVLARYPHLAIRDRLKETSSIVNNGLQYFENGDYNNARILFDKAIEAKPDDPVAYNYKADTYFKDGHFEKAIEWYDKALKINPHYLDVLKDKGLCFDKLGKYGEALACFNLALEISPRSAQNLHYKASILSKLSRYNEATMCYDQALEIEPNNFDIYIDKGILHEELKNYEKALECYDKAISLEPHNIHAKGRKNAVTKVVSVTNGEKYSLILQWDSYSSRWYGASVYVAIDSSEYIYVLYDTGVIVKFDNKGRQLKAIGRHSFGKDATVFIGKALGAVALNKLTFGRKDISVSFSRVADVAVDSERGYIYALVSKESSVVLEDENQDLKYYVRKLDSDGKSILEWPLDPQNKELDRFEEPSIAADSSGNIYVIFQSDKTIYKYDLEGKLITRWKVEDAVDGQIYSVACRGDQFSHHLYVNLIKDKLLQIIKFDGQGKFITKWNIKSVQSNESHSSDLDADSSGNVYISIKSDDTIYKYNSEGKLITRWTIDGDSSTPLSIAVDSSGKNVYLLTESGNVQRYISLSS
jgi:tetratricopeptide (TPR) repeat protein